MQHSAGLRPRSREGPSLLAGGPDSLLCPTHPAYLPAARWLARLTPLPSPLCLPACRSLAGPAHSPRLPTLPARLPVVAGAGAARPGGQAPADHQAAQRAQRQHPRHHQHPAPHALCAARRGQEVHADGVPPAWAAFRGSTAGCSFTLCARLPASRWRRAARALGGSRGSACPGLGGAPMGGAKASSARFCPLVEPGWHVSFRGASPLQDGRSQAHGGSVLAPSGGAAPLGEDEVAGCWAWLDLAWPLTWCWAARLALSVCLGAGSAACSAAQPAPRAPSSQPAHRRSGQGLV